MSPPPTGPVVLAVVGPTAVGKTAVALSLARRWNAEIVGADASQVYRGLDIGTGKVTAAEAAGVPHHLIDVCPPELAFDAGRYARLADAALADIHARGRKAILCGGTGLYLRALVQGLSEAPPVAPAIRHELQARLASGEGPALHAELARLDPEAAARIQPADHQRLERALGVALTTGRPLSDWHRAQVAAGPRHDVRFLGLTAPREVLRARIAERVQAMFAAGLVAEVAALLAAGLPPESQSLKALGYRDAAAVAMGTLGERVAIARTTDATRQYAKRQLTWFRAQPGITWHTLPLATGEPERWAEQHWGPP